MNMIFKDKPTIKGYYTKPPKIKTSVRSKTFENPYDARNAKIGGEILLLFSEVERLFKNLGKEKKDLDVAIIYTTHHLIPKIRNYAQSNNLWWDEPLGNISIDQEIVLEWWHENKKITIYVGSHTIDFIKVWGADMDNEMEDGILSLADQKTIESLWDWLIS